MLRRKRFSTTATAKTTRSASCAGRTAECERNQLAVKNDPAGNRILADHIGYRSRFDIKGISLRSAILRCDDHIILSADVLPCLFLHTEFLSLNPVLNDAGPFVEHRTGARKGSART